MQLFYSFNLIHLKLGWITILLGIIIHFDFQFISQGSNINTIENDEYELKQSSNCIIRVVAYIILVQNIYKILGFAKPFFSLCHGLLIIYHFRSLPQYQSYTDNQHQNKYKLNDICPKLPLLISFGCTLEKVVEDRKG